MPRSLARRLLRRPVPLAVTRLEDRNAPALFVPQAVQSFSGLSNNGCAATGDFNGDGKTDVVLTNYGDGLTPGKQLTVLSGQGNGQFANPVQLSVGANQDVQFVVVTDLNGDGKLDLVCTSTDATSTLGSVTTFLGNGAGGFTKQSQVSSGGNYAYWVGAGNVIAGDTRPDVIVANGGNSDSGGTTVSGNNFTVFQVDASGNLNLVNTLSNGLSFVPTSGAIGDFDGDGKTDVAFAVPGVPADSTSPQPNGTVVLWRGDGAGGFSVGNTFDSGGPLPVNVQAADLRGSGKLDLVVANAGDDSPSGTFGSGTSVGVLLNTGGGNFNSPTVLTAGLNTGGSTSAFAVAVSDFNLDGKADVAAITYGDANNPVAAHVAVYEGDGTGGFTADPGSPFTPAASLTGGQYLAVGDFDGNGTPDLVTVGASNRVATLLNQSVAATKTTTALASSANPAAYGTSVTFTATVAAAGGAPTVGTVTFYDGSTALGGAVAVSGTGVATFTPTTPLGAGSHTITAKYGGGTGFAASVSPPVTQVITQVGTLTTLTAAPLVSTSGDTVTFTATVTAGTATPAGSVTFYDGSTQLGGVIPLTTGAGGQQQAVLNITTLSVGPHTVTAVYGGSANFTGSTSNPASVTVNPPAPPPVDPTITVGSSANPSTVGGAVTFTATVSAPAGTPAGTVTFYDGATALGAAVTLAGSPSQATYTTAALTVGTHLISVKYGGGTGFNPGTSSALAQVVNPVPTSVAVASSLNPATVSQSVTLTATVSAASVPAGAVQFFDGTTAVSALVPLGAGNTATFTSTALAVGSHTFTAQFVPSGTGFAASVSAPLTQTVNKGGLTIAVTGPGTSTVTQSVTLTAAVTEAPVIGPDPTGSVTFKQNGTVLGTAAVSGGVATLTTTGLPVGSDVVTAEYAGDTNFVAAASPGFTQTVGKAGLTVTLSSPSNGVSTVGTPVTFNATVAETPAITPDPSALVTFKLNGAVLGTAAVSGGVATLTTTALPVGPGTVTAEYPGDANFLAATAAPFAQSVQPVGTSVGLATSSKSVTVSQTVTFTATVVAAVGSPAGQVQFFSGGTAVSGLLPVGGGKATFATAALPIGTTTVTAQFFPADPSYAGSTSPGVTQEVIKAAPAISLTVTAAPAGQPSTLRAAVTKPAGVAVDPGGTVTFLVNGTAVATAALVGGLATTTAVLPAGSDDVTAAFGGDGNYVTGAAVVTTTVSGGGSAGQKVGLVGYREFGVGAGAGHSADALFYNPDGTQRFAVTGLFSGTGGVRVTSADFNGDGVADLVAGTGPGGPTHVVVLDGVTRATLFSVDPFEASFTGGVYVAAGDLNGDGVPDLVISPDEGGGPRVRVFSGKGFGQIDDFYGIDDPAFRGGARAAVADMNGDGVGDLVVAAGFGGGPRVAEFDGKGLGQDRRKLTGDFFVFEQTLRNGAYVAAGDVDGDGVADLVAGGGPNGGPRVTVFSGADLLKGNMRAIANFIVGDPNDRGGIRVAVRDLDGDNKADLVVGSGVGSGSKVIGYSGKSLAAGGTDTLFSFDAFAGFTGGVYVG